MKLNVLFSGIVALGLMFTSCSKEEMSSPMGSANNQIQNHETGEGIRALCNNQIWTYNKNTGAITTPIVPSGTFKPTSLAYKQPTGEYFFTENAGGSSNYILRSWNGNSTSQATAGFQLYTVVNGVNTPVAIDEIELDPATGKLYMLYGNILYRQDVLTSGLLVKVADLPFNAPVKSSSLSFDSNGNLFISQISYSVGNLRILAVYKINKVNGNVISYEYTNIYNHLGTTNVGNINLSTAYTPIVNTFSSNLYTVCTGESNYSDVYLAPYGTNIGTFQATTSNYIFDMTGYEIAPVQLPK